MDFPCNYPRWLLVWEEVGKALERRECIPKEAIIIIRREWRSLNWEDWVFSTISRNGASYKYISPLKAPPCQNSWSYLCDALSFCSFATTDPSSRCATSFQWELEEEKDCEGILLWKLLQWVVQVWYVTALIHDLIWGHSQRVTKQQMWLSSQQPPLRQPSEPKPQLCCSHAGQPWASLGLGFLIFKIGWKWQWWSMGGGFCFFHFFVLFSLVFDLGMRKWGRGWDQIRFPQMIIQP